LGALCATCLCRAEVASVPDWLPAEYRFTVNGTAGEVAEIDQTLALMRDSIHPRLRAQMDEAKLGAAIQWTVHVLQPSATNDAAYFNTYRPDYKLVFDRGVLTNRIAKLNTLPTQLNLQLLFDEKRADARRRPIPGVDYPGVAYEDEGSTAHDVRLVLRAPLRDRKFRVLSEIEGATKKGKVEFEWVLLSGSIRNYRYQHYAHGGPMTEVRDFYVRYDVTKSLGPGLVAVFARRNGQLWGVPSFIRVQLDPLCVHRYANNRIEWIDYGEFRDEYKFDGKDRIVGFVRFRKGEIRGAPFSARGEYVRDTYSDDVPRTVSSVRYAVKDGKLTYQISDECVRRKLEILFIDTKGL